MPDFKKLVTNALEAAGIKAYHGSPHKFEKFDMSKIGTGEGAQSYGHGLYFAENPETARYYHDLAAGYGSPAEQLMAQGMKGRSREEAVAHLRNTVKLLEGARPPPYKPTYSIDDYREAAKRLEGGESHGGMYEVNIRARPEQFLDWEKLLPEQPAGQRAMDVMTAARREAQRRADEISTKGMLPDRPVRGIAKPVENMTGYDVQDILQRVYGPERASATLREAGIPGIRYLDQGSRFQPRQVDHLKNQIGQLESLPQTPDVARALAGRRAELDALKPTSNYVLFRDDIIDILKRYGIAAPIAGAVADQSNYIQPQAQ